MANPKSLSIPELCDLLRKAGSEYATEEQISQDITAGAPVNEDGTINLIHYAAWLVKGMGRGSN